MTPDALSLLTGKRVYVLGPMTGYDDHNRPAFREATTLLRAVGVRVISPDELDERDPAEGTTWADYLARDLAWVSRCEAGVALPGWRLSKGAALETCVLNTLGRPVYGLSVKARTLTRIRPEQLPTPVFDIGVHNG